jgi:hypothetical protein
MRSKIVGTLFALVLVATLVLAITPLAGVGAATNSQTFTESGTFVVPASVIRITVEAWGGGGAGGGSTNAGPASARGGAGGGGGAYASSTLTVEPGQTLQVVVGAGGTGVSGDDGNAGSSSFAGPDTNPANALVRGAAGSGGTGNTAGGSPAGGAGGTIAASLGDTRIAGANGENGATGSGISSGVGGNGANGGGSGGAAISNGSADGNPGSVAGGGGGGARTDANQGKYTGGTGAAGKVVITWVTYDLTIDSTDGGSATTPGEGTFTYGEGIVADLAATPDAGYRFVEWTGDVSTIADVEDPTTTITMNGDYSITASFEVPPVQYYLAISSTEGGSVTEPGEGVFTHDEGTVVYLVAAPDVGYRFDRWTGDVGTIGDIEFVATSITMNDNYSITAEFAAVGWSHIPEIIAPGGCFIATATYSTPMAEEIQVLREFRDKYLLTNPVGCILVGLYYKFSPPIAEFINEHPSLKPILRAGLLPAVTISTIAVNATMPGQAVIVCLSVLVSVVAVATWAMRRPRCRY